MNLKSEIAELKALMARSVITKAPWDDHTEIDGADHQLAVALRNLAPRLITSHEAMERALQDSPCGRLLMQQVDPRDASVPDNCLGCNCWRAALRQLEE
jgi:hypothetical protein